MVVLPPEITPPVPFMVTLFAANAGIDWLLALKLILPAVVAKVPLFTTLPKIQCAVAEIVSVPPVLMVIFRTVPVPPARLGMFGADEGIITSVVADGIPPHQLEAVFQSVLVTPMGSRRATVIVTAFDVAVD
jgi:hypothetical protein